MRGRCDGATKQLTNNQTAPNFSGSKSRAGPASFRRLDSLDSIRLRRDPRTSSVMRPKSVTLARLSESGKQANEISVVRRRILTHGQSILIGLHVFLCSLLSELQHEHGICVRLCLRGWGPFFVSDFRSVPTRRNRSAVVLRTSSRKAVIRQNGHITHSTKHKENHQNQNPRTSKQRCPPRRLRPPTMRRSLPPPLPPPAL